MKPYWGPPSSVNYWSALLPTAPKFLKRVVCTNCPQICSLHVLLNPLQSVFRCPTRTALVKSIINACFQSQESALGFHITFATAHCSSILTHILHSSTETIFIRLLECPHNNGVDNGGEKRSISNAFMT